MVESDHLRVTIERGLVGLMHAIDAYEECFLTQSDADAGKRGALDLISSMCEVVKNDILCLLPAPAEDDARSL